MKLGVLDSSAREAKAGPNLHTSRFLLRVGVDLLGLKHSQCCTTHWMPELKPTLHSNPGHHCHCPKASSSDGRASLQTVAILRRSWRKAPTCPKSALSCWNKTVGLQTFVPDFPKTTVSSVLITLAYETPYSFVCTAKADGLQASTRPLIPQASSHPDLTAEPEVYVTGPWFRHSSDPPAATHARSSAKAYGLAAPRSQFA